MPGTWFDVLFGFQPQKAEQSFSDLPVFPKMNKISSLDINGEMDIMCRYFLTKKERNYYDEHKNYQ